MGISEARSMYPEYPIRVEPRLLIENTELSNTAADPNTQNMLIHGDNLLALKALESKFAGQVKCIYIDPPYNTGHDFVYDDDFSQTRAEYDAQSGDYSDEGGRLVANPESNGRFHSDWCSMMYPRLLLARDLLSDDGAIFISISDAESRNMKCICDEIFGSSSFVANITWQNCLALAGPGELVALTRAVDHLAGEVIAKGVKVNGKCDVAVCAHSLGNRIGEECGDLGDVLLREIGGLLTYLIHDCHSSSSRLSSACFFFISANNSFFRAIWRSLRALASSAATSARSPFIVSRRSILAQTL